MPFPKPKAKIKAETSSGGIKRGFQNGTSGYAEFVCFGYKRGDGGKLTIDDPDAVIVRKMFRMRVGGYSLGEISNWLHKNGIPSPTGKARWRGNTISKLLQNEKYVGDILLQKTFVRDLFSGKQVKNNGELEKFLIREHHPPIASRELVTVANQVDKRDFDEMFSLSCHLMITKTQFFKQEMGSDLSFLLRIFCRNS